MKIEQNNTKVRKRYMMYFLLFLFVEIGIAVFLQDTFIRPYVGDMLVVVVLTFFLRIFLGNTCRLLPFFVFLFAAGVEILQYFHFIELLGFADNRFLSVLLGATFDAKDILCYFMGMLALFFYQKFGPLE